MPSRTTKASEIAAFLENAIISGHLPAGIVLRQEKLSEEFGVSRMPVREALRQLVAAGVASFEPHRGVRVRSISSDDVRQAFLIRAELEGLAADLAAARIADGEIAALRRAQAHCIDVGRRLADVAARHDETGMAAEWVAVNDAFHDVVLDAADAPLVRQIARSVRRLFNGQVAWAGHRAFGEIYSRSLDQHEQLLDALVARDRRRSRRLARAHVLDAAKWFDSIGDDTPESRTRLLRADVTWDDDGHPTLADAVVDAGAAGPSSARSV